MQIGSGTEARLALREQVLEVARRLEAKYGHLRWRARGDPLDVLIKTILSQNTNDTNCDRAYAALRQRFPTWEEVAAAPEEEIASAIQPGGLHRQKARVIKHLLNTILRERGGLTLDYLHELSLEEALQELMRFPGVGKKTAGVVLLFSLKKPYFPVDTHIKRIARRLGWLKGEDPHDKLNGLIPDELKYQLHLHLIRHGRETCRARRPRCSECILRDLCPSAQG